MIFIVFAVWERPAYKSVLILLIHCRLVNLGFACADHLASEFQIVQSAERVWRVQIVSVGRHFWCFVWQNFFEIKSDTLF